MKGVMNGMKKLNSRLESIERTMSKPQDQSVQDRIDKIEDMLESVERNMDKLQSRHETHSKDIGNILSKIKKDTQCLSDVEVAHDEAEVGNNNAWEKVTNKRAKPLREIMEETIRETGRQVMSEAIANDNSEAKLREDRNKNVIIYGVDEPTGERAVREEKDKIFVNGLLTEIEADQIEPKDIRRLGLKTEGKTRPIRIQWKEEADKETFMRLLVNLRNSEAKYNKIDVRHDLTPDQQKQVREARKEAKEMTAKTINTGFLYRVSIQRTPVWRAQITRVKAKEDQVARILKRILEETNKQGQGSTTPQNKSTI